MKKNSSLHLFTILMFFGIQCINAQEKSYDVVAFEKVIISPHIEVIFEKADKESVVIDDIEVPMEKLNVEVKGKTLHVYLDDAKVYTKSEKENNDGYNGRHSIYKGTLVSARVYYKDLDEISLRGDETHKVESLLDGKELTLKIYGESKVFLQEVEVEEFHATIYGESYLEIEKGNADRQRITLYGESEVNTYGVNNKTAKITAYGEGNVKLNVSDELKVTAYGEANIRYKGSPMVNRGIVLGEATIHQIN